VPGRWIATALAASLLCAGATARAHAAPPVASTSADTVAMDWSRVPEYRIVPGDVLEFNFGPRIEQPDEDLIRRLKVRPDGRIQVFPVGEIVAAGRTPAELQKALLQMLAADFREPRVTIEVAEPAGNQVHVMGQVHTPGSYPAVPFVTLAEAIARAGGFADDANRNDVLIFHRDGASAVRVQRVAIGQGLKHGSLADDVLLDRFDIVYVPRSPIGNLDVFVHQYFSEIQPALLTVMTGWELFNLDRVYSPTLVQKR